MSYYKGEIYSSLTAIDLSSQSILRQNKNKVKVLDSPPFSEKQHRWKKNLQQKQHLTTDTWQLAHLALTLRGTYTALLMLMRIFTFSMVCGTTFFLSFRSTRSGRFLSVNFSTLVPSNLLIVTLSSYKQLQFFSTEILVSEI